MESKIPERHQGGRWANGRYVCPHCNLACVNSAYHEGHTACQKAMRHVAGIMYQLVLRTQAFTSAWEFIDPWDKEDGESIHKELKYLLGIEDEP